MKTKYFLVLAFLLPFTLDLFSQDMIFYKDGSKVDAKVTLVGAKEIQYKKFNNPDGPVYSASRGEILMIMYENGEHEVINQPGPSSGSNKEELKTNFTRNFIHYHMFDLVFGDFTFSYERLLSNGMVGFKVPVSVGYDYYNDNYYFNSIFYSGLGVNFYPTGQGKWRYFLGPQVRFGMARENDWYYYYDEYGNYIYDEEVTNEGFYTQFFIDNGVMFTPVRNFSISAIASVGIRYFPEAVYNEDVVRPDGWFALNIAYRF